MVSAPLFFSTNLIFGKSLAGAIEPWTLAFIRWLLVGLLLLPFSVLALKKGNAIANAGFAKIGIMGFLGMWICGAMVYFALTLTSATNATLIYLSSPVLILIFEAVFNARRITIREGTGIALACVGVLVILAKGDVSKLVSLDFNAGDLFMVAAAIAWAVYSVMLRSPEFVAEPGHVVLCLFSLGAAILLAPFAATEMMVIGLPQFSPQIGLSLAGVVFLSSLLAFLAFQQSVRFAGPAVAGIMMYLLPIYGVGLAVFVLGEELFPFHIIGIVTILGGVILATFPTALLKKIIKKKPKNHGPVWTD